MDAAQKAELGKKWVCYSCSVKFYDLNKPEPLCPKCQADQRESPLFEKPKRKSTRKKTTKKAAKKTTKRAKKSAKLPSLDDDEVEQIPVESEKTDEINLNEADPDGVPISNDDD
ncbi:MAG: TIGR02300 family protein [bacterium]|nr:TIGR02300 family protein [bacterium]